MVTLGDGVCMMVARRPAGGSAWTSVPNGGAAGATWSRTASTAATGVSGRSETGTTRTAGGVVVITGEPPRRPVAAGRRLVDATRALSYCSLAVWGGAPGASPAA